MLLGVDLARTVLSVMFRNFIFRPAIVHMVNDELKDTFLRLLIEDGVA